MLDAHAKLRTLSMSTQDGWFMTHNAPGHTVAQLMVAGMFDIPAHRQGLKVEDRPFWVFVTAMDGPAIFVTDGKDDEGRLLFKAFVPTIGTDGALSFGQEVEADLVMPAKRGRPPKTAAAAA